jgi:hypothetical protein
MDGWDWVIYFGLITVWSFSLARDVRTIKAMKAEGREFGSAGLALLSVLLLPWAMRQAEKEYINEQKEHRKGNK